MVDDMRLLSHARSRDLGRKSLFAPFPQAARAVSSRGALQEALANSTYHPSASSMRLACPMLPAAGRNRFNFPAENELLNPPF
jgi:hypothetical protein